MTLPPIKDAAGRIIGASRIARDISQRKRTKQELRRHREHPEEWVAARSAALEAADRGLEAISHSVSHDRRTPARAIDGYSRQKAAAQVRVDGSTAGTKCVYHVRDDGAVDAGACFRLTLPAAQT